MGYVRVSIGLDRVGLGLGLGLGSGLGLGLGLGSADLGAAAAGNARVVGAPRDKEDDDADGGERSEEERSQRDGARVLATRPLHGSSRRRSRCPHLPRGGRDPPPRLSCTVRAASQPTTGIHELTALPLSVVIDLGRPKSNWVDRLVDVRGGSRCARPCVARQEHHCSGLGLSVACCRRGANEPTHRDQATAKRVVFLRLRPRESRTCARVAALEHHQHSIVI